MEQPFPTEYVFQIETGLWYLYVHFPEVDWNLGAVPEIKGDTHDIDMFKFDAKSAIGMYGTPLDLKRTTPMDMNAALHDMIRQGNIKSFKILSGYVPDESPKQVGDDNARREPEIE